MAQHAEPDAMSKPRFAARQVFIGTHAPPGRTPRALSPDGGLSHLEAPGLFENDWPLVPNHTDLLENNIHVNTETGCMRGICDGHWAFRHVSWGTRDYARGPHWAGGLALSCQAAGAPGFFLGVLLPGHGNSFRGSKGAH
ncbi:hypothetical protein M413DRAFT_288647 [Hebeloma cylindrosporum]|uniref:Uncharacterized protein n=1 Tax=Hebeloma cylindrosporum TaxID=76867 RepID=A0A0C3BWU2_HEBCY|nr:hypothetical protein M413DRAFT_288647 [Hebeloma cylindrosporum h7]